MKSAWRVHQGELLTLGHVPEWSRYLQEISLGMEVVTGIVFLALLQPSYLGSWKKPVVTLSIYPVTLKQLLPHPWDSPRQHQRPSTEAPFPGGGGVSPTPHTHSSYSHPCRGKCCPPMCPQQLHQPQQEGMPSTHGGHPWSTCFW